MLVQYPKISVDHTVDFDNPDILGYCTNTYKRRIKEALFIKDFDPQLNVQTETKKLFVFNVK